MMTRNVGNRRSRLISIVPYVCVNRLRINAYITLVPRRSFPPSEIMTMSSESFGLDGPPAPVPIASRIETIPLQEDHSLYEVEYIRDLIARRNIALDFLPLDEETVDDLGVELRRVGWPDTLRKGGSRMKKQKDTRYKDEDVNALICIKRFCIEQHLGVLPDRLIPFFENLVRESWAAAWNRMVNVVSQCWEKDEYDAKLLKLREDDKKSFAGILKEGFEMKVFTESNLQIAYVAAKKRQLKELDLLLR